MFQLVADLKGVILDREPDDFVSHFLFGRVPYIFSDDIDSWIRWRRVLANMLEVDAQNVVIVGSGSAGYSLNPNKNFKQFDQKSDVDCGLISSHHFDIGWRHLRRLRVGWMSLSGRSRNAIERHRKNYVFAGTIATDSLLDLFPFGQTWQRAIDFMGNTSPTQGRQIKVRIYKDYEALRAYHVNCLETLRSKLLESPEVSLDIGVES